MRSAIALFKATGSSQVFAAADTLPLLSQLQRWPPTSIAQRLSSNAAAGCSGVAGNKSPENSAAPPGGGAAAAAGLGQQMRSRADGATASSQLGFVASKGAALAAVPTLPKLLGFAGAIPFLALSPLTVKALLLHSWVDKAAGAQVAYGAIICTFLGAIHWGSAMSAMSVANSMSGGGKAAAALNERYMWSVVPSLAAWPIVFMDHGPASLATALLLGICYLSDKSYARLGSLPSWYMTLRGWLTLLAVTGTLSTTVHYIGEDIRKAEQRIKEEDEREAEAQAAAAASLVQEAAPIVASAKKKGWLW